MGERSVVKGKRISDFSHSLIGYHFVVLHTLTNICQM